MICLVILQVCQILFLLGVSEYEYVGTVILCTRVGIMNGEEDVIFTNCILCNTSTIVRLLQIIIR